MTSSTFLHSIMRSMGESRARLGTNSFRHVKGQKARSLHGLVVSRGKG